MELRDFLTVHNPLGPFQHEKIVRRSAGKPTDILIFHVDLFDHVIQQARPMIVGRRGAGKTAIVTAFLAAAGREQQETGRTHDPNESDDIYAFINSWDHLNELVDKVGVDTRHSMGDDDDWTAVLPETVAKHWRRRLWHVIFQQIYVDAMTDQNIRRLLPNVVRYVTGDDFVPANTALTARNLDAAFEKLVREVIDYLEQERLNCHIVIDSLEKYPVLSPKFLKVVSGFIRCINEFGDESPRVRAICCVPDEISPIIAKQSPNKIKDLSDSVSVSTLRWKPIELLKIVAERYRAFLRIHLQGDEAFLKHVEKMEFADRRQLREFFGLILPPTVTNRHGQEEDSLAYIIRHTQLLPREFILIFDRAILNSHRATGNWRYVDATAIVDAVRETEPVIADQILSPYETLYPSLVAACKEVIVNLPPIVSDGELRQMSNRILKSVRHETDYPWQMLFAMGVIGYCDTLDNLMNHETYEYARFHYNSSAGITLANDRRYCFHPVFSGTWGLRNVGEKQVHRYVYPADIEYQL